MRCGHAVGNAAGTGVISKSDVSTGAREAAIVLCGHVMSYVGHVQQLLAVLKVDLLKDSDTKE